MNAANDLGLTNAVPAKIIVHTDARLKAIKLGNLSITFKQAPASKLYWAGRPAMRVVQALHWLRDTIAVSDADDVWRRQLAALLADPAQGQRLRDDLADGSQPCPPGCRCCFGPCWALRQALYEPRL